MQAPFGNFQGNFLATLALVPAKKRKKKRRRSYLVLRHLLHAHVMGERPKLPCRYPGLSEATVQRLYIGTFMVFFVNNFSDWVHTFYAGKRQLTTFPLYRWVIYLLISSSAAGSLLTFLVFYLCMEISFTKIRQPNENYRNSITFLLSKIFRWATKADCFRMSFLMLFLEDLPITVINFALFSSCTVAGARNDLWWPQALSSGTTILSLIWRAYMTDSGNFKIRHQFHFSFFIF